MPAPTLILNANQPSPVTSTGLSPSSCAFNVLNTPLQTVLDPGESSPTVINDATFNQEVGVTSEVTARIDVTGTVLIPTFQSLDTSIATVNSASGVVSWVSNGKARIIISTARQAKRSDVTVSRTGGSSVNTFTSWNAGTLSRHISDQVINRIALVADIPASLPMLTFDASTLIGTWNTSCWTTKVSNVDLSAQVIHSNEFQFKYGGVLIAPDIVFGATHAGMGTTLHFLNPSNTTYTRTVVSTAAISGIGDGRIWRLNTPLLPEHGFTPLKLLSQTHLQTHSPTLSGNSLSAVFIPIINVSQFKKAWINQAYRLYQVSTGEWVLALPGFIPASPYTNYYNTSWIGGDSGHMMAIIVNNTLILSGILSGYTVPGQALTAINSAISGLGSIYTAALADLSSFPSY